MAIIDALSRTRHLDELNDPLIGTAEGTIVPSTRKQRAATNLGIQAAAASGAAAMIRGMPAVATAADTATLTDAQMLNGVIHGTPTAAATYTTRTGAQLDAALPDFATGDAFEFWIVNLATTATFDITLAGGTGVTITGPAVVGAGPADGTEAKSGRFLARKTGAATWTIYRAG